MVRSFSSVSFAALGLIASAACGDDSAAKVDAPSVVDDTPMLDGPPIDGNTLTPLTLAETGLCLDAGCTQISPDVKEYAPQFQLWADGATKRRWIYLPPGTKIDTSDMNYWKFPVGTKIWKEFTRDTVRVETRYIVKLADELDPAPAVSWYYVSYQWNLAQNDTTAVTQGAQNVNGTTHDIPPRSQCRLCHDNLRGPNRDRGRLLGFQAIQLDYDAPTGQLDLADLVAGNLLTDPPAMPGTPGAPYFALGSTTPFTAVEKTAFGYLHANCSHCHNASSLIHDNGNGIPMLLRLDTTTLTAATSTPTFTTTVNVAATKRLADNTLGTIVLPNDAPTSIMIRRMNSFAGGDHMPAAASEVVDPAGQTALVNWINALP